MANPEHLAILKQGVEVWGRWREENPNIRPNLGETNLDGLFLEKANLSKTNLEKAQLNRAYLLEADFYQSNLRNAYLSGLILGEANFAEAELTRATLDSIDLSDANFNRANLTGAMLTNANLIQTSFISANLRWVDLDGAILENADLSHANLSETSLYSTNLCGAILQGTDLSYARVSRTVFGDIDMSEVIGLDTVNHEGPSTIGLDTIYNSKGKIPELFLRGCGLSDLQIQMVKLQNPDLTPEQVTNITYKIHELHVGKTVQYHSCFISYSHKNEIFAQRLHTDLQNKGVRCWFAPEDMKIGDKIRPAIDQSIRIHDKLLVILSENSMQSDWVEDEAETAIEEEKKRGETVLFPIRLDEAVMDTDQAWAAKLRRTRHIGDFSRWKDHDAYQEAFERLLRDLKAEG